MGKKLSRQWEDWGSSPRGRRRVRPHVRRAASRDFLKAAMLTVLALGLLVILGRYS